MSNADKKATIIYLVDSMILSKNEYSDWREIQDEYGEKYKTNLAPLTCDETIDFFKDDFKQEENWPFTKSKLWIFEGEESVICSICL